MNASEVGVPCLVIPTITPSNSSRSTPSAAAGTEAFDIFWDNSSKVVLPWTTVENNLSATDSASFTGILKALIVLVKPSTAVPTSVTPAIAAFEAVARKAMAFSFGIPEESVWYKPLAALVASTPSATERFRTSFRIVRNSLAL